MATLNEFHQFEAKVKSYSNSQLIEKSGDLLKRGKSIDDALLLVLAEVVERRVYAELGYPSLFELLTRKFGLAPGAAYHKMAALRLIAKLPEAKENLLRGETNISQLALLQSHIQETEKFNNAPMAQEEKSELLSKIQGLSNVDTKEELHKLRKVPDSPKRDTVKPIKKDQVRLSLTISKKTHERMKYFKDLISHKKLNPTWSELLEIMIELSIETTEKKKGIDLKPEKIAEVQRAENSQKKEDSQKSTDLSSIEMQNVDHSLRGKESQKEEPSRPQKSNELSVSKSAQSTEALCVNPRSRYISREVKRAVVVRSGNRCEFVSDEGHRCRCTSQLQFEHQIPWAVGGSNELENIQYFCRGHNQLMAYQFYGAKKMKTFAKYRCSSST